MIKLTRPVIDDEFAIEARRKEHSVASSNGSVADRGHSSVHSAAIRRGRTLEEYRQVNKHHERTWEDHFGGMKPSTTRTHIVLIISFQLGATQAQLHMPVRRLALRPSPRSVHVLWITRDPTKAPQLGVSAVAQVVRLPGRYAVDHVLQDQTAR